MSKPPARTRGRAKAYHVVFLAYARGDNDQNREWLKRFQARLQDELQAQWGKRDIHVFRDETGLSVGTRWEKQIEEELERALFIVPVISPFFLNSTQCWREMRRFLRRERFLLDQHEELGNATSLVFPVVLVPLKRQQMQQIYAASALAESQTTWHVQDPTSTSELERETVKLAEAMARLLDVLCSDGKIASIKPGLSDASDEDETFDPWRHPEGRPTINAVTGSGATLRPKPESETRAASALLSLTGWLSLIGTFSALVVAALWFWTTHLHGPGPGPVLPWPRPTPSAQVRFCGSGSVRAVMRPLLEAYLRDNPGDASHFQDALTQLSHDESPPEQEGTYTVTDAFREQRCDVGMLSASVDALKEHEPRIFAEDAIAVLANPTETETDSVTRSDLQRWFEGKGLRRAIAVADERSGTTRSLLKLLNLAPTAAKYTPVNSFKDLVLQMRDTPNSVGVVSWAYLKQNHSDDRPTLDMLVKVRSDGQAQALRPNEANIKDGSYGFKRKLSVVVRQGSETRLQASRFVKWLVENPLSHEALIKADVVPVAVAAYPAPLGIERWCGGEAPGTEGEWLRVNRTYHFAVGDDEPYPGPDQPETAELKTALEDLVNKHPNYEIVLVGFADTSGSQNQALNCRVSKKRANKVRERLGIDAKVEGVGIRHTGDQDLNRRVEVWVRKLK